MILVCVASLVTILNEFILQNFDTVNFDVERINTIVILTVLDEYETRWYILEWSYCRGVITLVKSQQHIVSYDCPWKTLHTIIMKFTKKLQKLWNQISQNYERSLSTCLPKTISPNLEPLRIYFMALEYQDPKTADRKQSIFKRMQNKYMLIYIVYGNLYGAYDSSINTFCRMNQNNNIHRKGHQPNNHSWFTVTYD